MVNSRIPLVAKSFDGSQVPFDAARTAVQTIRSTQIPMQEIVRNYPWLFHIATLRKWHLIREARGIDPALIDDETKKIYRMFYGGAGEVAFFGVPSYYDRGVRMIGSTTPDRKLVDLRVAGDVISASGRLELDYTADWGIDAWQCVSDEVREAAKAIHKARACNDVKLATVILQKTGTLAVFTRIPLDRIEANEIDNPVADETSLLYWGDEG
jgi:hypothetical protein